jgi:hypothetical protein
MLRFAVAIDYFIRRDPGATGRAPRDGPLIADVIMLLSHFNFTMLRVQLWRTKVVCGV